jgi:hypothetical protein
MGMRIPSMAVACAQLLIAVRRARFATAPGEGWRRRRAPLAVARVAPSKTPEPSTGVALAVLANVSVPWSLDQDCSLSVHIHVENGKGFRPPVTYDIRSNEKKQGEGREVLRLFMVKGRFFDW